MRGPNELDNPDFDEELRKGDEVYFAREDEEDPKGTIIGSIPYEVFNIGSSKTDFDYILRSPSGEMLRVKTAYVRDIDGKTCLINAEILTKDTTELSLPEMYEDYELLGTEESRQGQYVVINLPDGEGTRMKKLPIALWGHYMVKSYTDLRVVSTRTTVLPMVCLSKQLEPQRVTPEMFVDWAMI
jgi:hypothetical protein